jgi:hypothetical protein
MTSNLHPALVLAREARESGNPMSVLPSTLWRACQFGSILGRGSEPSRADHFRHAMLEAGHIISNAIGKPFAICPICGWRADGEESQA